MLASNISLFKILQQFFLPYFNSHWKIVFWLDNCLTLSNLPDPSFFKFIVEGLPSKPFYEWVVNYVIGIVSRS